MSRSTTDAPTHAPSQAPTHAASQAAHELLTQLIALTSLPPADHEIDALLAASEALIAQRAELFEHLTAPIVVSDADRPLVAELERRDAAWQAALTAAMRLLGEQRHGTEQLRAYAPSV
jgi:hypothetical protein